MGDVACGARGLAFGSCELSIGVVEFAEEGRGGVVEDVEGWWHGFGDEVDCYSSGCSDERGSWSLDMVALS